LEKLSRNKLSSSTRDNKARARARRLRRIGTVAAVGLTPVIALAWAGCGDDDTPNASISNVDPGGTWGAEVTVTIKGRGRVLSATPGVDCPGNCFTKYIFANQAADGGSGGLGLKAMATPGSRFTGWTFDTTTPIGSRGRGSPNCNPISRPGANASVDTNATDIVLPFGETQGTGPEGQSCAGQTTVPVVYNITANFDTPPPPPEAGPDGGGALEVVYNPSVSGATGKEIGLAGSYMFWRYGSSGYDGIAFGQSPTSGTQQTAQSIVFPTTYFLAFEIDTYGVVYQTASNVLNLIRPSLNPTVTPINGGSSTSSQCNAVAVDSNQNVYCRTSSTLMQWSSIDNYATPKLLYGGLPSGSNLALESATGSFWYSSGSTIYSNLIQGPDSGTPNTIVLGASSPSNLELFSSRLVWLQSGGAYGANSTALNQTGTSLNLPFGSYQFIAPDYNNSSDLWIASSSAIYHVSNTGGNPQPLRTDLSGIGGIASYSSYVFVSQADGTIRRISRSGF
jgi:hypothetical protein